MSTLDLAPAPPLPPSTWPAARVVWVLEQHLSQQRQHLRLDDAVHAALAPATASTRQFVDRIRGQLEATSTSAAGELFEVDETRPGQVTGQVRRITAVTVKFRQGPDGAWVPALHTARLRTTTSTCAPDPARSVWPPSGEPVLLGFLLALDSSPATT